MVLRTSNFFGFCYADDLPDCEFFAKNFEAITNEDSIVLSFDFSKDLDFNSIRQNKYAYSFFEIEDLILRDKLIDFLKPISGAKKMKLSLGHTSAFIKRLKFTSKGFVFHLVSIPS
ncbi:MAG: hypothetical protein ABF278_07935 [Wenyingzhuangia sp.]|uniref:hypothetical protein n=1 Tax=Wenyingzhuangia sp. TaxID=1964193 RepID=UPI00321A33B3